MIFRLEFRVILIKNFFFKLGMCLGKVYCSMNRNCFFLQGRENDDLDVFVLLMVSKCLM